MLKMKPTQGPAPSLDKECSAEPSKVENPQNQIKISKESIPRGARKAVSGEDLEKRVQKTTLGEARITFRVLEARPPKLKPVRTLWLEGSLDRSIESLYRDIGLLMDRKISGPMTFVLESSRELVRVQVFPNQPDTWETVGEEFSEVISHDPLRGTRKFLIDLELDASDIVMSENNMFEDDDSEGSEIKF